MGRDTSTLSDVSADGVFQMMLKGGTGSTGKSKVTLKGKGSGLPLPIAASLTTATSVTIQVRGSDAPGTGCWSITLSDIKKQEADLFKAK